MPVFAGNRGGAPDCGPILAVVLGQHAYYSNEVSAHSPRYSVFQIVQIHGLVLSIAVAAPDLSTLGAVIAFEQLQDFVRIRRKALVIAHHAHN